MKEEMIKSNYAGLTRGGICLFRKVVSRGTSQGLISKYLKVVLRHLVFIKSVLNNIMVCSNFIKEYLDFLILAAGGIGKADFWGLNWAESPINGIS